MISISYHNNAMCQFQSANSRLELSWHTRSCLKVPSAHEVAATFCSYCSESNPSQLKRDWAVTATVIPEWYLRVERYLKGGAIACAMTRGKVYKKKSGQSTVVCNWHKKNASLTASSSELLVSSECSALHHVGVAVCTVWAVWKLSDHEFPV